MKLCAPKERKRMRRRPVRSRDVPPTLPELKSDIGGQRRDWGSVDCGNTRTTTPAMPSRYLPRRSAAAQAFRPKLTSTECRLESTPSSVMSDTSRPACFQATCVGTFSADERPRSGMALSSCSDVAPAKDVSKLTRALGLKYINDASCIRDSAAKVCAAKAASTSGRKAENERPGYGNCGFDMSGKMYDLKELRDLRNVAIIKGMNHMAKFFAAKQYAALYEVGDDAPAIFFECWYTSANSSIRCMAKDVYKCLMPIFENRLLWLTSDTRSDSPPPAPPSRRRARNPSRGVVKAKNTRSMAKREAPADSNIALIKYDADGLKNGHNDAGSEAHIECDGISADSTTPYKGWNKPRESAEKSGGGISGAVSNSLRASKERGTRPDRDDFFAFMFLLRCKHEMGEDTDLLLQRADVAWSRNGFSETNKLFGHSVASLKSIPLSDWLVFLMRVMIMELNQLLFRARYPLQWGLRETLSALRFVELTPPPKIDTGDHDSYMRFHHSFYLATHIAYVQSAYNSIRASQCQIPWLYRYIRVSFRFLLKRARARLNGGDVYLDIDGVAEVIDCLRGAGMTEASDKMVCEGTLLLLRLQRPNGSWPAWLPGYDCNENELDHYHRIHPTWVCTQALRDRDFRIAGNDGNHVWSTFIPKLLADVNFKELGYKPDW